MQVRFNVRVLAEVPDGTTQEQLDEMQVYFPGNPQVLKDDSDGRVVDLIVPRSRIVSFETESAEPF